MVDLSALLISFRLINGERRSGSNSTDIGGEGVGAHQRHPAAALGNLSSAFPVSRPMRLTDGLLT